MDTFDIYNGGLSRLRGQHIQKSFGSNELVPSINLSEEIEKGGKRAHEGEVRTWGGKKMVKHSEGWVYFDDKKGRHTIEDKTGKVKPAEDHHVSHAKSHLDRNSRETGGEVESKEAHEARGFDESKGDVDVTGKTEDIPVEHDSVMGTDIGKEKIVGTSIGFENEDGSDDTTEHELTVIQFNSKEEADNYINFHGGIFHPTDSTKVVLDEGFAEDRERIKNSSIKVKGSKLYVNGIGVSVDSNNGSVILDSNGSAIKFHTGAFYPGGSGKDQLQGIKYTHAVSKFISLLKEGKSVKEADNHMTKEWLSPTVGNRDEHEMDSRLVWNKVKRYLGLLVKEQDVHKSQVNNAFASLGVLENLFELNDELTKGTPGLVAKRVQVHTKEGGTHYAIRWVSPDSGLSEDHSAKHEGYKKEDGIEEDEQVTNISNHPSMKPMEKVRKLVGLGVYDNKSLSHLSGHKYPSDIASAVKKEVGINYKDYHVNEKLPTDRPKDAEVDIDTEDGQKMAITRIAEMYGNKKAFDMQKAMKEEVQKEFGLTVDDKWESYETDLNMLLDGELGLRAVMGYGTGGVGKTFTLESKIFPDKKLIEFDPELDMESGGDEYDYVKIGGKIGSKEIQRLMYNHSGKILVFDDCDSMWNDEGLINVLKNALDTSGRGKTQWAMALPETEKGKGDNIPSTFTFNGRMIFITNLSKQELQERGAAAVVESRCASTDLSMNMEQTMGRLSKIKDSLTIKDENRNTIEDVTSEDKDIAFKVFGELSHIARIDQLNTRVLTQLIAKARYARRNADKLLQGQDAATWVKKQFLKQLGF